MKPYRLDQLKEIVEAYFDDRSVQTVLGWFKANEGRRPVIVVGSGYTRNAKRKNSDARADAPLWPTLVSELAGDLSIDANFRHGTYDALTLAELYEEEFGPNALHNKLLSLVEDEDYEPDEAHEALLAYEAEAIITTNFLDTVLERCIASCFTVTLDNDLTIYDRQTQKKQLIYFHGHRSNFDTWVFTRSQYEDVFGTRPVVATRVRQLLSQYPVLAVGYSLSDPDFHQIYRQISLDMANRHPLGLAILIREPLSAERRHWECIGLRIAVLKKGADLHDAFARFFALDPNGPLPPIGSRTHRGSGSA